MSILPRLDERGAELLPDRVRQESGGSFRNTVREPGLTCLTCTGPVTAGFRWCRRCHSDAQVLGASPADLVVPVTYAVAEAQSGYVMHSYKAAGHLAAPHHRIVLSRLLLATLHLHGACLENGAGRNVTAWASVPSSRGRDGEHPVRGVARLRVCERPRWR